MRVALIGGGSRSALALRAQAHEVAPDIALVPIVRRTPQRPAEREAIVVSDYFEVDPEMLAGFDAVINFVGAVHARTEAELLRINARLAVHLAGAAREAGAAQFIHLSSLSVHGRATLIDARSPLTPISPYGRSKLAAERLLLPLSSPHFVVTLLRVPIIYGRGWPSKLAQLAHLLRLLRFLPAPGPLPRRSIISQQNLARVLLHLLRAPRPGAVTAADPQPFQLDEFARLLPFEARIIPLPPALFAPVQWVAPSLYASLFAPLEVADELLLRDTRPPLISTQAGLRAAFPPDAPG